MTTQQQPTVVSPVVASDHDQVTAALQQITGKPMTSIPEEDADIEFRAIVDDVRAGVLPITTVADELAEEQEARYDPLRVEVLQRALDELFGRGRVVA